MSDDNNKKELLTEWELSWVGKLFFAGVAAYLGGKAANSLAGGEQVVPKLPIKIKGTPEQIKAVVDAITSSKAFQDEIRKNGATVDSVISKLNLKNLNKANFERVIGKKWPL
jgi:hypothetical protein